MTLSILSCSCLLNGNDFLTNNVPQPNTEASEVIHFCITRNVLAEGSLKIEFLQMLKDNFNAVAFVESGTYKGFTTTNAAEIFREVHTVELSKSLSKAAKKKFKKQKHIKVYRGDSGKVFCKILPEIKSRILFYLDGHYSGSETAQGIENTPLMKELKAIEEAKKSDSIILIDDIRCFQDSCYPEKIRNSLLEGYPKLKQLIPALLRINPNYQVCFLGDALLAFPRQNNITVSPVVNACTMHRLSAEFPEISEQELVKADQIIKAIQGKEKEEMILYQKTFAPFELENGLRSFGTLWLAMIYSAEGKEKEASNLFQQAIKNSNPGWRAYQLRTE
ncbi:MAG: hypothetical protein ABSA17_01000 [Rhabdochlamydiaceae bacterium]